MVIQVMKLVTDDPELASAVLQAAIVGMTTRQEVRAMYVTPQDIRLVRAVL